MLVSNNGIITVTSIQQFSLGEEMLSRKKDATIAPDPSRVEGKGKLP